MSSMIRADEKLDITFLPNYFTSTEKKSFLNDARERFSKMNSKMIELLLRFLNHTLNRVQIDEGSKNKEQFSLHNQK